MGQGGEDFGHQRTSVGQPVGGSFQTDHGEFEFRQVLLLGQAGVHRHQDLEALVGLSQQGAVLQSRPADQGHGLDGVTGEIASQSPVEVFIEQNPHVRPPARVAGASAPATRLPGRV